MCPHVGTQRRSILGSLSVLVALLIPAIPASAATDPVFYVDPVADAVWGDGWAPDADVMVSVGTKRVVTVGTARTDAVGSFATGVLARDIKAGDVVSVTVGTTSSPGHTVTALSVGTIDAVGDAVSGSAVKGSSVEVGIVGGPLRSVTASGTGAWTAGFSGAYDILTATAGYAAQYQTAPGATQWFAATWIQWRATGPVFRVDPDGDAIFAPTTGDRLGAGFLWPARTPLSITIAGVDGSETVLTARTDRSGSFRVDGVSHDLVAGDVVTVSDGTTAKSHTVTDLALGAVVVDTDQVTGTAASGAEVYVQPTLELGAVSRLVTADETGAWTADFSVASGQSPFDIRYMQMGYATEADDDGDATHIGWHTWVPRFWVDPDLDAITGWWWGNGDPAIDPAVYPEQVRVTIAGVPGEWLVWADGQEASFTLDLSGEVDIAVGDSITVEGVDLDVVKTHTVAPLTMSVDEDRDTVTGTGVPGTVLRVVAGDWECGRPATVDKKGVWFVDFSVPDPLDPADPICDLTSFTTVTARQADEDGDETVVQRPGERIVHVWVDPDYNGVWGWDWDPGVEVTITVNGGATYTAFTDETGEFLRELDPEGETDLVRGDTVTVTDGVITKVVTISSLAVTQVDQSADTVTGVATPGSTVTVGVWDENGDTSERVEVIAASDGSWVADFFGVWDVQGVTVGDAGEPDDDGDGTQVDWRAEPPSVPVTAVTDPDYNAVWGWGWAPGVEVTIAVNAGAIFTAVTDESGWFLREIDPVNETDLLRGDTVTVTDGVITKVVTISVLAITDVDTGADTVTGVATAGRTVTVGIWDEGGSSAASVEATAGSDGVWVADLAGVWDVVTGTFGYAAEADDDGDETMIDWRIEA